MQLITPNSIYSETPHKKYYIKAKSANYKTSLQVKETTIWILKAYPTQIMQP